MKIFENIKFKYHTKEIEDLIAKNNFNEVKLILRKISIQNKVLLYRVLKFFYSKFISVRSTETVFYNNLILINSFLSEDQNIISEFLKFYFKNINFPNYQFEGFSKKIIETRMAINSAQIFDFQEMIMNSIIYQMLLSIENDECLIFLNNDFSFFSSNDHYNFCDSGQIKCFFHIVDHPYSTYSILKNKFEQQKELTQNQMFNLDGTNKYISHKNINLEIIQKGWVVHTKSWRDANVVNSMRGELFYKENFFINPLEAYTGVVLHLRQSGVAIPINYNIIEDYINTMNPKPPCDYEKNISNNEKKFIRKNYEEIKDDFNFKLD